MRYMLHFSIGSDYSSISYRGAGSTGGTPSRLSVGRGAGSGWNTPTPGNTWNTEGTPSYTASSLSGAASLGETGPSAAVGQSSLDDVCDVCVGPMFVSYSSFFFTFLKSYIAIMHTLFMLSQITLTADYTSIRNIQIKG